MKNIMKFSLLMAASIFANACADGESSETLLQKVPNNTNQPQDTTSCTAGKLKCSESGTYSYICENNDWLPRESCLNGCMNGECIKSQTGPSTSECVNETRMCSDDGKKIFKCVGGSWTLADVCDYGCKDGACSATQPQKKCDENTKKCSEDGLKTYICNKGEWAVNDTCANGCKSGECISSSVMGCTDGNRKCADDNSHTIVCKGSSWQDGETCTNGCNDGQCLPPAVPECNNGSRKCADDNSHTIVCNGNSWQDGETCTNGCKNGECIPPSVCTDNDKKCADDGSSVLICSSGSWSILNPCSNGCASAQCINDDPGFTCAEGYAPCDSSCRFSDEQSCSEYCTSHDSDICCMNDEKFVCGTGEVIPDDVPFYCGDFTLEDDGTTKTVEEYCGSKVGICVKRDGSIKFSCDEPCTASQVNDSDPVCKGMELQEGRLSYVALDYVCTKIDDTHYTYRMDASSAVICTYGCDSSGISCTSEPSFTCSGAYVPCDASCYISSDVSCMQNCEAKGSSVCCMDDSYAYCYDKGAEVPPSFTCTGDYEPCDSTCLVDDDTTCMAYCESKGRDICCMDDTNLYCYDKGAEE